jgi:DNA-binding transcriptional MerR regulator
MATKSDEETKESPQVTVSEAARVLGCSRKWVHQLCTRGLLKHSKRGNNALTFKMSDIQELIDSGVVEVNDSETVQLNELQNELTQMALEHVRKTFEPVTAGMAQIGETYQKVTAQLLERITSLEKVHLESIQQRELFMSEQHARDMARLESEARRQHIADMLDPLKKTLPTLLEQLGESLGGKKRADFAALVAKLAASGKLQVLLDSPVFLSADEQELLREVLKDFLPKEEVETTGEPVPDDTSTPPQ